MPPFIPSCAFPPSLVNHPDHNFSNLIRPPRANYRSTSRANARINVGQNSPRVCKWSGGRKYPGRKYPLTLTRIRNSRPKRLKSFKVLFRENISVQGSMNLDRENFWIWNFNFCGYKKWKLNRNLFLCLTGLRMSLLREITSYAAVLFFLRTLESSLTRLFMQSV